MARAMVALIQLVYAKVIVLCRGVAPLNAPIEALDALLIGQRWAYAR